MKCDELKQVENPIEWGLYYDKVEVDEAIAELKARIQLDDDEMAGFLQLEEECGGGDLRNYIAELKAKLENVQATAYAEMVDAGMRERRLRRALWLARAERAKEMAKGYNAVVEWCSHSRWIEVERKCRAKAEQYK